MGGKTLLYEFLSLLLVIYAYPWEIYNACWHFQISNFEYLMQLNTLAGRSYNDITQVPLIIALVFCEDFSTIFADPL